MRLFSTKFILAIALVTMAFFSEAQNFKLNLYANGAIPNYKQSGEVEVWDTTNSVRVGSVQMPDIAAYLPSKEMATGKAVVICPGGGYNRLAYGKEGEDIAKMLNANGIAAFVLKYRLPTSISQIVSHKSPLMDAQRALRLVRFKAKEWNIDPDKIGIMGFSAGGHLASTLSTHFDEGNATANDTIEQLSCRPDFSVLIYPVISFTGAFQHSGSRKALVGNDEELMNYYSNELQITENTPPAILIHASDDKVVPVENSIVYYQGLIKNGIAAEMHIYPNGGHGFGLAIGKGYLATWPNRVVSFINDL